MDDIAEFETWVKSKGGQTGLVAAFRKKFGDEIQISQTAISNWISRRKVPLEKRPALKVLGWPGPYEWPETEAPVSVTADLDRRLKVLEAAFQALAPLASAVKDLDERVRKLSRHAEPS